MEYDVFISHASEDKDSVALPLAAALENAGLSVWIDKFELTLGDSLRDIYRERYRAGCRRCCLGNSI